jgi:phage repressor protein C with HTH and peptisase S24 domain
MEPTLHRGDLVVFEYHRSLRRDNQIVIANLPETGSGNAGTESIKRISQDADHWIFGSDNPAYAPIRVPKVSIEQPILGIMVGKLLSCTQV